MTFYAIAGVLSALGGLGLTFLLGLPLPFFMLIGLMLMMVVLAAVEVVGHIQDRRKKF